MSDKNDDLLHEDNSDEELMEAMKADKEVDGEAAAEEAPKVAKKSAPAKADDPDVDPKTQDKMEKLPGTKTGMINAAFTAMSKMSKKDLAEKLKGILEAADYHDDEDEDDMEEGKDKKYKKEAKKESFKEDLDALVDSEATLSESFRSKAEVIFEAALRSKLAEHVERLEESYAEELAEEKEAIRNDLVEKVDSYLNYVVENWMAENELAINNGLRTEIAESFISGLHSLFAEHYVAVPESKVDLVDELGTKVQKMEQELSEAIRHNVVLSEHVKELTRDSIIREAAFDLSETQAEKLKSLAEDIDFTSEDSFKEKVSILKESYFNSSKSINRDTINEETEGEADVHSVSPQMKKYLSAFDK